MHRRRRQRRRSLNSNRPSDQINSTISASPSRILCETERAIQDRVSGIVSGQKNNRVWDEMPRRASSRDPRPIAPLPGPAGDGTVTIPIDRSQRNTNERPRRYTVRGTCKLQRQDGSFECLDAMVKDIEGMSCVDIKESHAQRLCYEVRRFKTAKYRYRDKRESAGQSWKAIGETTVMFMKLDGGIMPLTGLVWKDNVPFELRIHKNIALGVIFPTEPGPGPVPTHRPPRFVPLDNTEPIPCQGIVGLETPLSIGNLVPANTISHKFNTPSHFGHSAVGYADSTQRSGPGGRMNELFNNITGGPVDNALQSIPMSDQCAPVDVNQGYENPESALGQLVTGNVPQQETPYLFPLGPDDQLAFLSAQDLSQFGVFRNWNPPSSPY